MKFSALSTLLAACLLLSNAASAQRPTSLVAKDKVLPKNLVAVNTPTAESATTSVAAPVAAVKEFKGTVLDELGEPLAGVMVSVVAGKNQFSNATVTNAAGEYSISSTHASPLLLVTYAGCLDIQQQATYMHPITFQMEEIRDYDHQLKKQAKAAGKARRN